MNIKQRLDRIAAELERRQPQPRVYIVPSGQGDILAAKLAQLAEQQIDPPGDGDSVMARYAWAIFHGSEADARQAVAEMKAAAQETLGELARQGIVLRSE